MLYPDCKSSPRLTLSSRRSVSSLTAPSGQRPCVLHGDHRRAPRDPALHGPAHPRLQRTAGPGVLRGLQRAAPPRLQRASPRECAVFCGAAKYAINQTREAGGFHLRVKNAVLLQQKSQLHLYSNSSVELAFKLDMFLH